VFGLGGERRLPPALPRRTDDQAVVPGATRGDDEQD